MKQKALIIVVIFLLVTTGCWNRRELNTLAIAVGMGIDKEGDEYVVSFQVVNPGEVASNMVGGKALSTVMFKEKGDTLFEAIRRVTTLSPRKIYVAHLRMVIIGEKVAEEGIGEVLDLLSRGHETRTDFYLAVASNAKAEEVLKVVLPLEKIPSNKLFSSLEVSEQTWAPTIAVTLDEMIASLIQEGKNPVLTGVKVLGKQEEGEERTNLGRIDPDTRLQYEGIAVFKKDRLVGWMNETESKGYIDIIDKLESTIVEVPCSDKGKIGIEILRAKSDMKGNVEKDEAKMEVTIKAVGTVGEVQCTNLDLMKPGALKELEKQAEQVLKENSEAAVKRAKELQTDIFGFGQAINRKDPDYWKKVKKEWNEIFVDLPVGIDVTVEIEGIGTVKNSVLEGMEE